MMTRLVENRKVILENEMNQRWGSVYEQEPFMNEILEQFLDDYGINAEELLDSDDMKGRFLERLFPECLAILQNNTTTGVFVVLTGQGTTCSPPGTLTDFLSGIPTRTQTL